MEKRSITVKGVDKKLWSNFRRKCFKEEKTVLKSLTEFLYVTTTEIRKMDEMYEKSQPWNNGPGDEEEEEPKEEEVENESKDESESLS